MADDMTIKEFAGIIDSNTTSVGIQAWNLTSDHENIVFKEKYDIDNDKYQKVYSLKEVNTHPFNLDLDFDIFIEKGDEALTVL